MRPMLYATILAVAAVVVLAVTAHAAVWGEKTFAPSAPRDPMTAPPAPPALAQRPTLYALVVKEFGAAVRVLPSREADIAFNARCGDVWPVVSVERGWVKVRTDAGPRWIGGGRVLVTSNPPVVDCTTSRDIRPTAEVTTVVTAGCEGLHARPSSDASLLACVGDAHRFTVLDGPFDPGTGEDWFRVTSPSTGSGWAQAASLFPV